MKKAIFLISILVLTACSQQNLGGRATTTVDEVSFETPGEVQAFVISEPVPMNTGNAFCENYDLDCAGVDWLYKDGCNLGQENEDWCGFGESGAEWRHFSCSQGGLSQPRWAGSAKLVHCEGSSSGEGCAPGENCAVSSLTVGTSPQMQLEPTSIFSETSISIESDNRIQLNAQGDIVLDTLDEGKIILDSEEVDIRTGVYVTGDIELDDGTIVIDLPVKNSTIQYLCVNPAGRVFPSPNPCA